MGARLATGDILLFADADVIYESTWIESLLQAFIEQPQIDIAGGYTRVQSGTGILNNIYAIALNCTWMFQIEKQVTTLTPSDNFSLNNMALKRHIIIDYPIAHDMPVYRGKITQWKQQLQYHHVICYRVPNARGYHAAPGTWIDWLYRMLIFGADPVSASNYRFEKSKMEYHPNIWHRFRAYFKWQIWKLITISKSIYVLIGEQPMRLFGIIASIPLCIIHILLFMIGGGIAVVFPRMMYDIITTRENQHVV